MKIIAGNSFLKKEKDCVFIDLVPINEILSLSETPIMIFLENRIKENIRTFCDTFKSIFPNFEGFYSFKANYLPEICSIIKNEGLGAELIGLPELNLALSLGFKGEKLIVGGPYLPNNLIEKCIMEHIKEIIVYNLDDLNRINEMAKLHNKVQYVCLRIRSNKYASKLGIVYNVNNMNLLNKLLSKCNNIKVTSILSHFTTQMNNFQQYHENLMTLIKFHKNLKDNNVTIDNINLGGGFPEASIMQKDQLQIIAEKIRTNLEAFNITFKSIYFEPGRYIVGDSGLFITTILNQTLDRWIFIDLGNNICPKFAKCSLRFYNISRINEPHKFKTSIAGIVPTDQDVLAKNYFFTKDLINNDKVMVLNVGAYCLTFSNRFPYRLPRIFLINGRKITKIFDQNIQTDFFIK
ncbi:MAG: hypothetical protein ACFFKA_05100 [Candidatus Thorarchaeota archaeon]